MSWLARSIANSLKFDDDDDDGDGDSVDSERKPEYEHPESPESQETDDSSPTTPSRGVKEDLSEFSKTLTRQFWGVASFLAPPPQPEQQEDSEEPESEGDPVLGMRGDLAEIGGKFRNGISRLSNNINVSEITKIASNLLQLESDDESEESGKRTSLDSVGKEAIGVTEEVLAFARDMSMHPKTWLDFPLPEIDGYGAGFEMSDAQQGHALAIDRLAPSLAALRLELCPEYMSESNFWKIYFVLLHPRLDEQDAEFLSTLQIMEARSLLAHEVKNRKANVSENLSGNESSDSEGSLSPHEEHHSIASPVGSINNLDKTTDPNDNTPAATASSEIQNHPVDMKEVQIEEKPAMAEKGADQGKDEHLESGGANASGDKDEDDADEWLKEETSEIDEAAAKTTIAIEDDDDVSFSDLEEDDPEASNSFEKSNYSSGKDSPDWVRL
ncbi:uncharacterized protein LOC127248681 [Andrographis paniculata]|uniref:uncharacterized protein LOC127248681 n=1 Tax=Andrographis paniculata TaxID=175694 RepID=UPI0021E8E702|nr:uncharacterized protein LOC127248681 [Andrographis paniculata]